MLRFEDELKKRVIIQMDMNLIIVGGLIILAACTLAIIYNKTRIREAFMGSQNSSQNTESRAFVSGDIVRPARVFETVPNDDINAGDDEEEPIPVALPAKKDETKK